MATILDLIQPEIVPFDPLTPKILYHRTKHEVDRTRRCGDIFHFEIRLVTSGVFGTAILGEGQVVYGVTIRKSDVVVLCFCLGRINVS